MSLGTIDLVICVAASAETLTVPDVVGLLQSIAESTITTAGFTVGDVTTAYSDTVTLGFVISQSPVGGTVAEIGSDVDIVISLGPESPAEICGHYNRTTGEITFTGAACTGGNYCGEYVRTGAHAGQIEVTVDDFNINDVFYGCFDRDTGNFSVLIPDTYCSCLLCGEHNTPEFITAIFSDMTFPCYGSCSEEQDWKWELTFNPNDKFLLQRMDVYSDYIVQECTWLHIIGDGWKGYDPCNTLIQTKDVMILVTRYEDSIRVCMVTTEKDEYNGEKAGFCYQGEPDANCVTGTYANSYINCNTSEYCPCTTITQKIAYGGSVQLIEGIV